MVQLNIREKHQSYRMRIIATLVFLAILTKPPNAYSHTMANAIMLMLDDTHFCERRKEKNICAVG